MPDEKGFFSLDLSWRANVHRLSEPVLLKHFLLLLFNGQYPFLFKKPIAKQFTNSRAALINWLKPLVNFTKHLTEEMQNEFLSKLADQMLIVDPIGSDGKIHIHHLKLELIAKKIDPFQHFEIYSKLSL